MDLDRAHRELTTLGFTDTEAAVYCELLRTPRSTGYRIAKLIKKSQANVYSALASLTGKGAVVFENSEIKSYKVVAPSELLPRIAKEFEEQCRSLETSLATYGGSSRDDSIYQLRNTAQVYDRVNQMCASASDSIAFEAFHNPFTRIREFFLAASGKGVGIAGVVFNDEDKLPGATCVLAAKAARVHLWPGDQLTIVTDAREALVALLDRSSEAVLHAIYTDSVYLSCLLQAAVVDAVTLNQENPSSLRSSLNKRLFGRIPRGFLSLIAESK